MFTRSHLPTELPAGLPKAVTEALAEYQAAVDLFTRADDVTGLGDRDLDAARSADKQLIMDALANGDDIERVGKPNEAAFLNKRDAYRQARQLAATEAAKTSHHVAGVLGDHAETIVEAFAAQASKAAEAYLAAVTSLATARAELEVQANRLRWATSIDGHNVPSLAIEQHPRKISLRTGGYSTDELAEILEADADELAGRPVRDRQQRLDEAARQAAAEERNAQRIANHAAASMARREARREKRAS